MAEETKIIPATTQDINAEITADGTPIAQTAAPQQIKQTVVDKPTESEVVEEAPEETVEQTPEQIKEAEQTAKDDAVDFSKFLDAKSTIDTTPKTEDKTELKKETKEEVEPVATATKQTDKVKLERDVSDLDPDIAPLFKQNMSNEAFNKLKPIILEHKKIKADLVSKDNQIKDLEKGIVKIPESYYEHPQSFVLTPEFGQLSNITNTYHAIANHWADQLAKVREGASKYVHIDYNPKTGGFDSSERPADARAEIELLKNFNYANSELTQSQAALKNLASTHQAKYKDQVQFVENFAKQAFQIFDKPEGKQYEPILADTIKNFPPAFHNNPLMNILARSLVVNQQLGTLLQKMAAEQQKAPEATNGKAPKTKEQAKKVALKEDVRKAGPTSKDTSVADASGNGEGVVTFDEFERVKQGI